MTPTRQLRIVIPGGTGQLGTMLARHFHEQGHLVSTITRFPKPHEWESVHWDAQNLGDWASSFNGADAVINLAGQSVRCRYTAANKRLILSSRVRTTQLVGEAISRCAQPPGVWLNASTANIYPHSLEHEWDDVANGSVIPEINAPRGWSFSVEVAQAWEAAVSEAHTPKTRKVMLRMASVMGLDKGKAFDNWLRLVRMGWGGEVGNGEQYVSWIHDFDFVRSVEFLIEQGEMNGPVNISSPRPLENHQFMCSLRRCWCTSYFGLPMPKWLVGTVGFCIRREPELVLKSLRVIPRRLLDAGFSFHFPEWRGACANLVERWRVANAD